MIHGVLIHEKTVDGTTADPGFSVVAAILHQLGQGRRVPEVLAEHPSLTRGDLLSALNLVAAGSDRIG